MTDSARPRLPDPARVPIPGGVLGRLVLRPWLDAVILRSIVAGYLPLSRGWAAAREAGGSADRFRDSAPFDGAVSARLAKALGAIDRRDREYREACEAWDHCFFGNGQTPDAELIAREGERRRTAHRLMAARVLLVPWMTRFGPVRWRIADRETVAERHAGRLDGSASAFPPPPATTVERSREVRGALGHEYWLHFRAPSPRLDENVWAHVYEPDGREDPPSLIALHGIAVEPEMWKQISEPDFELVRRGFRVIRIGAPGHARRTPVGCYGGEPVLARGPLGFIELFEAWVAEVAVLIGWARQTSNAPVAIAGLSLGALTGQLVATAARAWPERLRPDAVYLTATSGDVVETVLHGSIARALGAERALRDHGWSRADIERWRPVLEPRGPPAVPPDRIVMVLGAADTLTPYAGGAALAAAWDVPPRNLFVRRQGHFTVGLEAYNDPAPMRRLAEIVKALAG